ncbi:MAG: hypothetical protein JXP73_00980 [Deltaproteobacteria bacterium]|nr:hypothetical protein [Deltaproteobacteria bacterium]
MRDPYSSRNDGLEPQPEPARDPHEYYDDENEADYDDGEDDVAASATLHRHWSALAGFVSPEWWSR